MHVIGAIVGCLFAYWAGSFIVELSAALRADLKDRRRGR